MRNFRICGFKEEPECLARIGSSKSKLKPTDERREEGHNAAGGE